MCFSASASFVSSGLLLTTGVVGIKTAYVKEDRNLAMIPLLFGIQQSFEGFIWLGLQNPEMASSVKTFTLLFLLIAWIIYPVMIPAVFRKYLAEKKALFFSNVLFIAGLIVSVYHTFSLAGRIPFAEIDGHHIYYHVIGNKKYGDIIGFLYVVAVLLPPFLTRRKTLWILGAAHIIMFAFSYIFMTKYLISVWCFLSAISSAIIIYIIFDDRIKKKRALTA